MSNDQKKQNHTTGPKEAAVSATAKQLVKSMPIASALLNHDAESLGNIIQQSLPNPTNATVDSVIMEKSAGEAFTGGRSTPVYHVSCFVTRQQHLGKLKSRKQRHFVAKLILMPSNDDDGSVDTGHSSNAVLLPDTPEYHALWVKRESYAVERRFYDCVAPRLREISPTFYNTTTNRSQLTIPNLLASDRDGSRPWPAACFFMNDLRHAGFPRHPEFLSPGDMKRALRWIASFHAHFWGETTSINTAAPSSSWRRDLWHRGGFWTGKHRNADTDTIQVIGLAQQWSQTVRFLETKHPSIVTAQTKGLGKRLEAASGPITEFITQQCMSKTVSLGTLIHGDYKAANMFLAENECSTGEDESDGDASSVAVLDFQFTGLGLGAEDVAYVLFPDAKGHYFESETELLSVYHQEFIS